jgi:hypothetical protein
MAHWRHEDRLRFLGTKRFFYPDSASGLFCVEGAKCGGNGAAVVGVLVFVGLAVGGFDEFVGGAAVFGVDAEADADADGWLALIGLQTVLDAVGDLFGHTPVRVNHDESNSSP